MGCLLVALYRFDSLEQVFDLIVAGPITRLEEHTIPAPLMLVSNCFCFLLR